MTEKERRAYNKEVSKWNAQVRAIRELARDQKREYRDIINELAANSGTQVPQGILDIMENIIKTQNKGVMLSPFQEEMLDKLMNLFSKIDFYEANRPKIEDGMIKDLPIRNNGGIVNYTNPGKEEDKAKLRITGLAKKQQIATLFPDGSNVHDIIDRISETIAENARLQAMLNEEAKTVVEPKFHKRAGTEKRLIALQELNEEIGIESKKEVSEDLATIVNAYQNALSSKMRIEKNEDGSYSLDNVPIKDRAKENANIAIDKVYVKLMELGLEPEDVQKIYGGDPKVITMLPKNITEKLIEVLSRVIQENSKLHNKLYKPDELKRRKWPWKIIAAVIAGALAAAVLSTQVAFLTSNIMNALRGRENHTDSIPDTSIENVIDDKKEEDSIGLNEDRNLASLVYRIDYGHEAHVNLTERKETLGEDADKVYDKVLGYSSSTAEKGKTSLGADVKNMTYQEMLDEYEAEAEDIIRETIEFVNSLDAKTTDNVAMTDIEGYREWDGYGREGTFKDWHKTVSLTPDQYKKYDELYDRAYNLYYFGSSIDGYIKDNEIYLQKLYQKTVSKIESELSKAENQATQTKTNDRLGLGIGIGVGGGALATILGVLGANALKIQAKKKEAEASNENNKEGGIS